MPFSAVGTSTKENYKKPSFCVKLDKQPLPEKSNEVLTGYCKGIFVNDYYVFFKHFLREK